MQKRKPKTQPIEPLDIIDRLYRMWLQITPEDFIDVVLRKNLTVIRRKEPKDGFYYYLAIEIGIVYYTRSKMELREIHVDILIPRLGLSSSRFK